MSVHDSYLQHAIALATANVENGGRPFGALIVHRGDIVARAVNTLHQNGDPTAHAELNAIFATSHSVWAARYSASASFMPAVSPARCA